MPVSPHRTRVLIVEDEPKMVAALSEGLRAEGFETFCETTGEDAFFRVTTEIFDLVLLDLGLPRRSGLDVLRALRAAGLKIPVLVLSASDSVPDRVTGLDAGADDYLVKPFAFAELVARIRALERRRRPQPVHVLRTRHLSIDVLGRRAECSGHVLDLTSRECQLLEYFVRHLGQAVSREALTRDVWREPSRSTPLDNVIDVYVTRLRRKLQEAGAGVVLKTTGVGFSLEEAGSNQK